MSCSSAKKKSTLQLDELSGKKVALVSIDAEDTAKKIIEVALINQIVERGTFILISKQEIELARAAADQDALDWKGIAKRAGADYALQAKALEFDAPTHEGYSTEEVKDSQLAEEQGTDGITQKVFKVKAMDARVKVQLQFTQLSNGETRAGVAEGEDHVTENARNSAIHLPPKLRFLEALSNRAFKKFFEEF